MKNIYLLAIAISIVNTIQAQGTVNLPYVLTFTENDSDNWSDGILEDGDGGSADIIGLDLEIFTAGTNFLLYPGSTMVWYDNNYYYSSDASYNGITSGPDIEVTNNGVPAMVMRSTDPSVNFSLDALQLYDWGGVENITIQAFDNNVLLGSVDVEFDVENYTPKTISEEDELLSSIFSNVDEIRFFPKAPAEVFYLSLNDISLSEPSTLPVTYGFFKGVLQSSDIITLEWETLWEHNASHFDVEVSFGKSEFEKVASVKAKGNSSSPQLYRYEYKPEFSAEYLFRLKQVDLDGQQNLSEVIVIRNTSSNKFFAGPNPTKGKVFINNPGGKINQLRIYNSSGSLQKTINAINLSGNRIEIDLSDLNSGLYFISVIRNQITESLPVFKY